MPHLLPAPFSSPKTLQSCFKRWCVFLGIYCLSELHIPAATSAEQKQRSASQLPMNITELQTLKKVADLDSPPCLAYVWRWSAGPRKAAERAFFNVQIRANITARSFSTLPLWIALSLSFSLFAPFAFHVPSPTGLCPPSAANSSSWKSYCSTAMWVLSWRCG